MRNFIKIHEIVFDNNSSNAKTYEDYLRPSEIVFIEPITKANKNILKVHFKVGSAEHVIYVLETIEELEKLINAVYKKTA